jgi:hypothetical protein
MKIPGPGPGVKSIAVPTPYSNTDTRGAFGEAYVGAIDKVDVAISRVDQAMEREAAENERAAKEARAKADAISSANADAAYQRAETARMVGGNNRRSLIDNAFEETGPALSLTPGDVKGEPGFLSTRGKAAFDQSESVIADLDKNRQKIAKEHFADAAARERWLARSNGMLADTERRVEQHSAQQFEVARKDALEGIRASAIEGVANASDAQSAANFTLNAEARIRELADSPEGAEADVARFRQDVLGVRIGRLLSDGDVEAAEGQYEAAKTHLGSMGPKVKHAIDQAKKAQAVQAFDVEAQKHVDMLVEVGTKPNGQPDLDVIDAKLSLIPPGKLRDEVEQRLGAAKEKAARRWKQRVDRFADDASSTYEKTRSLGAVDPKVKSWLQENAPEEWKKLRKDAEADITRMRTARTGDASARREQAEIDRLAMLEFRELPIAERAVTDVNAFLRGRGASPIGSSAVRGEQTRTQEVVRAGDAIGETEFIRSVEAATRAIAGASKDKAKDIKAQAVQAYGELRKKANGKPSEEDVQAEIDRLTAAAATAPRLLESVRGKGVESEVERRIRVQKEAKGKATPPALGPPASARPSGPQQMTDRNGVLREKGADGKWRPVAK